MTQNDPFFDEIINDVINKYLVNPVNLENVGQTSITSDKLSTESETVEAADVPILQRLRPRKPVISEKKRVNIISNEPYTGIVPDFANLPTMTPLTQANIAQMPLIFIQNGIDIIPVTQTVPTIMSTSVGAIVTTALDCLPTSSTMAYQNFQQSEPQILTIGELNEAEKKESTPKITLYPGFLESKSKSTPRRKAQHVRILDFNQTPSNRRLSMVKEFTTPSNGIPTTTPGSAPVTMTRHEEKQPPAAIEDESSNPNSISQTPKVSKKCRTRKIAVQKSEEKIQPGEEELKKPVIYNMNIQTREDWNNMRTQSKVVPIDQLLRLQNQEVESNSPKKRRTRKPRVAKAQPVAKKSPPKKKGKGKAVTAKQKSPSIEIDENKPLSAMKFRISSPRKIASARKSPKTKKKTIVEQLTGKFESNEKQEAKAVEDQSVKVSEEPSELNRSDTVQEVAMVLTNFPETIMARHKSTEEIETITQIDLSVGENVEQETPVKDILTGLDETPFKSLMTPLPNTPRFAVPLTSNLQETPMPKIFASTSAVVTLQSLVKNCDIPTPSFPITPGFKLTPLKDLMEASPVSEYYSRRTDYSSSSSYYKPDESEDINQNINAIINQRRNDRMSQSESESGIRMSQSESESGSATLKIVGGTKKVDCPGAIERVKSFSEDQPGHPAPHYEMMDKGLLSESFVTTGTDDSSSNSSSFTCSTCSTDESENENTMEKLKRFSAAEGKDSEWECEDPNVNKEEIISLSLMNEKTGEVRFPIRNWITPRKIEITQEQIKLDETNKIKSQLHNLPHTLSLEEEKARIVSEQEVVKKRTLATLRRDAAAISSKSCQKFKKSQVKNYKLPADAAVKTAFVSRKDQILQHQFSERPRPTPLRLIPSTSSSRRKNATPQKTIVINELPREQSRPKNKTKLDSGTKQTTKNRVLENESDNAVMPEDSPSLEISSSFNTSNEEETASTVVASQTPAKAIVFEDGSNTFQRSLMAQGFDKTEAKDLQAELVDKMESISEISLLRTVESSAEPSVDDVRPMSAEKEENKASTVQSEYLQDADDKPLLQQSDKTADESEDDTSDNESDDESETEEYPADESEKHVFNYEEPANFKANPVCSHFEIRSIKFRLGAREVNLADTDNIDLFYIDPEHSIKVKNSPKKPAADKSNGKSNGKSKSPRKETVRWDQSKSGSSKPSPSK